MFLPRTAEGTLDDTGGSGKIGGLLGNAEFSGLVVMWTSKFLAALIVVSVAFGALFPAQAAKYSRQSEKVSELLLGDGIALVQREQFEDAIKLFEQAVVAYPKNAQAYSYLGFAHQQTGNLPDAKKFFGIALAIDPDEVRALNWGGQSDLSSDDLDAAQAKLDRLSRVCGPSCSEYKDLYAAVNDFKAKVTN